MEFQPFRLLRSVELCFELFETRNVPSSALTVALYDYFEAHKKEVDFVRDVIRHHVLRRPSPNIVHGLLNCETIPFQVLQTMLFEFDSGRRFVKRLLSPLIEKSSKWEGQSRPDLCALLNPFFEQLPTTFSHCPL
jgi:hypothetical protein